MDIRSFKNADIDRKNEEQMNTDDEPTMDCARCGRRGLGEGQVCIREWEGDSDAPMCAPCWDTTEEEEYADEEGGAEALEMLLEKMRSKAELVIPTADNLDEFYNDEEQREIYQALKKKFDPDMVSAEIVEEGHPYDGTPHHYCEECDCCVGCDCCECRRLLVCLYCGRDENECEEQTEEEQNPITEWFGGWGMSCDDCYYKHHPEDEEKDELNSAIDASGNALY
jgi:hypothetical protein